MKSRSNTFIYKGSSGYFSRRRKNLNGLQIAKIFPFLLAISRVGHIIKLNMKRRITAIICAIIFLYGAYYWGIPSLLNKSQFKNFIENKIASETGYKIKLENPKIKMGLLPAVWMKADDVAILNNDNSKALDIQHPVIKVKLLPFIFKKAEISYFSAHNADINLIFDKNSKLKLGQYPIIMNSNSKVTLKKAVIHLDKYGVHLTDEIQNKQIFLDGKYFILSDFIPDKKIEFSTASNLFVGEKASKINLDVNLKLPLNKISKDQFQINGNIQNVDLSDFNAYVKVLTRGKFNAIAGILNFTAETVTKEDGQKNITSIVTFDNFELRGKDRPSSIWFDDRLEIKNDISTIKNGLNIHNFTIKAENIDLTAQGKVSKLNAKYPYLDLKTTINNTRSENIIPLLPGEENLLPEFNFYLLKKHVFYSLVNGHMDIKGKANAPDLFGKILVSDGYLTTRVPNAPRGATVKMDFNKNIMGLDVLVPADPEESVAVRGKFLLFKDKTSDLYITSTPNINLKKIQPVLLPLHNIIKFEIGPVPMMAIAGYGNINLHVIGNKQNPHAWGVMNFRNATASFNDIHNLVIKNLDAKLTFDDRNTTFKTIKGTLNGLPVSVDGTCTLLGNLDYVAVTKGQNSSDLIHVIKTSPMLAELQEVVKPVKSLEGKTDFILNLTGNVKANTEIVFNENLFAKGTLDLYSNTLVLEDLPARFTNLTGKINFENKDGDFNVETLIGKSKVRTNGTIKNEMINAVAVSDKFLAGDALKIASEKYKNVPYLKDFETINTAFVSHYKGKADGQIHYDGISIKGKIYNNRGAKSRIIIQQNGTYELDKGKLTTSLLKGSYMSNPYTMQADILDLFSPQRVVSGNFTMRNFDLKTLNELQPLNEILPQYGDQLKDYGNFEGKINIASKMKNNNLRLFTQLENISFVYKPKHLRVRVLNGQSLLNNETLYVNKINAFIGRMPIFVNGKISNVRKNPDTDIYINAKPTQEFFDQFFNNKSVYPIKVKGDILCTTTLNGPQNHLSSKTEVKMDEGSSIYYMGATVGDMTNPVRLYLDNISSPNSIKINQFKYDKIITSQNNKQFPNTQLIANGTVDMLSNNNIRFHNFKIKTETPTDAKIFNIIFKKPLMKQGLFTSDLTINGDMLNPRVIGTLNVTSIDVPFFDMRINDTNLDFKKNNIIIKSKGSILNSTLTVDASAKNKLTPPYIIDDVTLNVQNLDLNRISESLQDYDADMYKQKITSEQQMKDYDLSQLRIKKAEINADNILVKALNAQNFKATMDLDDKMNLNVTDYHFTLAEGNVNGNVKYNINDKSVNVHAQINDANAQIISESLFDLKGQLYGTTTGTMDFACDGKSQESCLRTLSGEGSFDVTQGKMPKLGSLEYLLKASNLVTGGITGISINGIIDLITPLKTGHFESISGDYKVEDGIAKNINIYSKGKDLNIYVTGAYNIVTSIADMHVYGSISNNITTVFGKLKNASLNTLLNTIPLLNKSELSPELLSEVEKIPGYDNNINIFKIFIADIDGDINGSRYVRSFKWVK